MPEVVVALGSNMGDRLSHLKAAVSFLQQISAKPVRLSSIYESEPVGPGTQPFYNAVVAIYTTSYPSMLLPQLKAFEIAEGRDPKSPRWSDRPLDLDIIGWGRRRFMSGDVTIPHASYRDRLFVLLPLRDICPNWIDPLYGTPLQTMIDRAQPMNIQVLDKYLA